MPARHSQLTRAVLAKGETVRIQPRADTDRRGGYATDSFGTPREVVALIRPGNADTFHIRREGQEGTPDLWGVFADADDVEVDDRVLLDEGYGVEQYGRGRYGTGDVYRVGPAEHGRRHDVAIHHLYEDNRSAGSLEVEA